MLNILSTAEQFFYNNAGFSYNPDNETKEEGKVRTAKELAKAELWAIEHVSYEWKVDEDGSLEYQTWQCNMRNTIGMIEISLFDIDFGKDGTPWNNSYRRVVQAELACEIMSQ